MFLFPVSFPPLPSTLPSCDDRVVGPSSAPHRSQSRLLRRCRVSERLPKRSLVNYTSRRFRTFPGPRVPAGELLLPFHPYSVPSHWVSEVDRSLSGTRTDVSSTGTGTEVTSLLTPATKKPLDLLNQYTDFPLRAQNFVSLIHFKTSWLLHPQDEGMGRKSFDCRSEVGIPSSDPPRWVPFTLSRLILTRTLSPIKRGPESLRVVDCSGRVVVSTTQKIPRLNRCTNLHRSPVVFKILSKIIFSLTDFVCLSPSISFFTVNFLCLRYVSRLLLKFFFRLFIKVPRFSSTMWGFVLWYIFLPC